MLTILAGVSILWLSFNISTMEKNSDKVVDSIDGFVINDASTGEVEQYPIDELDSMPCNDFLNSATFDFNNFEQRELLQKKWNNCNLHDTYVKSLQTMSCDEIIYYNQFETKTLTQEERKFVRDALEDCRDEMMQSEEFAMYGKLGCDGWIAMDGKLHVINSNQVRDWIALEILDCKGRN